MTVLRRAATVMVGLAMTAGVAVAAADVFQEHGLERGAWADSFLRSLTDGASYLPRVSAKLKSVPPARRAVVVNALGSAAKSWFASEDFRSRYAKEYEASLPDDLRAPRSAGQIESSATGEMQKALKEMEETAKSLQGDARRQVEAAIAQMRAEMKRQAGNLKKDAAEMAAAEKTRNEAAKNRPADPNALSSDPRASLRKALKIFLAETSAVDFAAETRTTPRNVIRFAKPDHEAKPRAWKACYRAGREACEAARTFATAWLAELK